MILRTATMLKKVIDHPDIDAILPSLTWSLLAPLNLLIGIQIPQQIAVF
jgi:hypothetical protein